jgi:PQQ-like domain
VVKWSFTTGAVISYSSPAIGTDGTVYIGSYDGNLYALDSEGQLKWKYHTGAGIRTSPSIGDDGTVFIGARHGRLFALTLDGILKWTYDTDGDIRSSTAVSEDGTAYFGSWDGHVYAVQPDGKVKWLYKTNGPVESSPTVGADGTVYIASADGYYYAFSPEGVLKWKLQSIGIMHAPAIIGQDGVIYITSDSRLMSLGSPLPAITIHRVANSPTAEGVISISLNLTNPSTRNRDVEVKAWMERHDAGVVALLTEPQKSLPAGADQWQTLSVGPLGERGAYKIRARLLDPTTGELISESLATFSLNLHGAAQLESSLALSVLCRTKY